ncbi:hypothetical protein FHS27_005036 [Rhodopirellula rubra]|uniref:Uncharacterized protein n=1 Tax=Aporhodopirellula rubra TaxID=980271 RepID=A0A7W5H881_9BACT|nr:hypothetical protein [Aporhodopirellula rubra]MBB3209198.1 hypothetical protein [Aporhodopirellula rubra]
MTRSRQTFTAQEKAADVQRYPVKQVRNRFRTLEMKMEDDRH